MRQLGVITKMIMMRPKYDGCCTPKPKLVSDESSSPIKQTDKPTTLILEDRVNASKKWATMRRIAVIPKMIMMRLEYGGCCTPKQKFVSDEF